MKIGILTFHDADNCGAVLQAYALTETIKRIEDKAIVEIIDYKMPYVTHQYKIMSVDCNNFKAFTKSIIGSFLHLKRKISSKPKYNYFRNEVMNISEAKYINSKDIKGYDVYIVGSDQVWNSEITKMDPVFFLDFAEPRSKKISYAASIAKEKLNNAEIEHISKYINKIDCISVREKTACDMLKTITTKEVQQVLDPTLIAEKSIWDSLISTYSSKERYILVYMVGMNEEVLRTADSMSKKLGLPVWCITTAYKNYSYKFKFIRNVGPIEFLSLVSKAEFIISSSFHGTAFAIIYNKNFITIPHKKTSSRMIDLLHMLKLENRIVHEKDEMNSNFNLEVDYKITNEILEKEKEKSLSFLKNSIEISKKRE